MSERGPVGGAGELTALGERIAERIAELLDPQQLATLGKGGRVPSTTLRYNVRQAKAAIPKIVAEELAALAAKAPQGVPHSLVSQLKDYIWQLREAGNYRCTQTANDIERMLDADASPKLPAAGPVSDDTIHHGMVPPVPPGTPHSSEVPCMTCGRPKPVIYSVNVQTCPGCFQPFDTREAAAQHRGEVVKKCH